MNQIIEYFQSNPHLSHTGFAVRTIVSMLIIYFMSKFLKKRANGQFTTYDFTFLWMLGALSVSLVLDGKVLLSTNLVAIATLYVWHYVISWLSIRSNAFAKFIRREPAILFQNGILDEKKMKGSFYNNDLLLAELRLAEVSNLAEVEQVILEPNGHLSVQKKPEHNPIIPTDFKIAMPKSGISKILINKGQLNQENIQSLNLSIDWIINELNTQGIKDKNEVYLATINPTGELFISKKIK